MSLNSRSFPGGPSTAASPWNAGEFYLAVAWQHCKNHRVQFELRGGSQHPSCRLYDVLS